jgi:hypothetical protein
MLAGLLDIPEVRALVDAIADCVVVKLRADAPDSDWIDQRRSQLGRNRHCKVVRERLAANPNDPSASHVGDRFLLTRAAVTEEMRRAGKSPPPVKAKPPAEEDAALARIRARLQVVK